ncbi:MAG TPA: GNAT family N-acetyltransferase [Micromonosporaceae bacterium]
MPRDTIDGDGVRLRPVHEDDVDDIVAACADPSTLRFLHNMPDPYTHDDALWWVTVGAPVGWANGGAQYTIVDPLTDRLWGSIGITRVFPERAQGEIGYWVAPWARGRHVATAAARTLTDWAFRHGLARLELLTEWENIASQRVALGAGYQREGVRRSAGKTRGGGRHDLIAWARVVGDPDAPVPRLLPDLPDGRLSDGTVTLRPLAVEDTDALYFLRTLPEVVATTVPGATPDRAAVARICARAEARWLAGERAELALCDAETGEFAGEIALYLQDPLCGQAMIGYSMLPAWRGRGYPVRAVRLLAHWAFDEVGLSRLIAGTDPANHASQRVLEKVGFTREGYQRDRLPTATGGRQDDVLWGLLPRDLSAG